MRILIIRPAEEKKSSSDNPKEFLDEFFPQTKICSCFEVKWKTFLPRLIFLARELRIFLKLTLIKELSDFFAYSNRFLAKFFPFLKGTEGNATKNANRKLFLRLFTTAAGTRLIREYQGKWGNSWRIGK